METVKWSRSWSERLLCHLVAILGTTLSSLCQEKEMESSLGNLGWVRDQAGSLGAQALDLATGPRGVLGVDTPFSFHAVPRLYRTLGPGPWQTF